MRFHCPKCGEALANSGSSLRCGAGHTYDLAKEGYCNLLLVQQKASLDPGDNKEMVEARRRFLAAGHFAPIAQKQNEIAQSLGPTAPTILDAGCGEGYYLGCLRAQMPAAELVGVDISKWAVRAAAKTHKNISWAVASSKQLPFAKNSLDLILCAFGFPFWESFRSVLKAGGAVLLIDPGPEHLWSLRELVYDQVKANDLSSISGALAAGFTLAKEERLDFEFTLATSSAIQDLLAMTPHGYRMNAAGEARVRAQNTLRTRASVILRLLYSPGGK